MSETYVPDFLKIDTDIEEESPLRQMMLQYQEKFGRSFCTEGKIMTDEEWIDAMKECIKRNVEMNEYLGLGEIGPDDEI